MLLVALAVGSRGSVKYSNLTISKVKKGYWTASASYPKFQSGSAISRLANHDIAEFSAHTIHEWATDITKDMEKPTDPWAEDSTTTVVLARPDLISLEVALYSDSGGAHPNTQLITSNFGMVKGKAKKLTLADLFKRGTNPLPLVSKIVMAKLKEKNASWIENGDVKALDLKSGDEFVIATDRLTYIFSPYEMGSYAEGSYIIDVPFAALGAKLDPSGPLKELLSKD